MGSHILTDPVPCLRDMHLDRVGRLKVCTPRRHSQSNTCSPIACFWESISESRKLWQGQTWDLGSAEDHRAPPLHCPTSTRSTSIHPLPEDREDPVVLNNDRMTSRR